MANIQISALLPVGYDLFNDAASFMNELATDEVQNVLGGGYHHHHHSCHSHHNHHYSHKSHNGRYWGY
ncbi:hypothetical protein [Dolichospermum heterosporum]|uniref:Uncharacterized protein n=1 Tax=Dolichospermum heterosporum TAC447 TaxID=747523 RepID=A0ABY5LZ55_9CYAN|nr:hypothetical protein [Dolichospermum heterosporum]UUO14849.1 hypothetical protein NG743_23000 [Dolichospermum heterosporum TAC447]